MRSDIMKAYKGHGINFHTFLLQIWKKHGHQLHNQTGLIPVSRTKSRASPSSPIIILYLILYGNKFF
jgi:hypothetical protein